MEKSEVLSKVLEIIKIKLDIETNNLTLETRLDSFIDSLEVQELAMKIEDDLNVRITDHVLESWVTISDVSDTYLLLLDN